MADFFRVKIVYSQSHLVFPKIIIGILIILAVIMLLQRVMKAKKEKKPIISLKNKRFFEENYDKLKFYGTIVLFILYIIFMDIIGFLTASIIFVTLFNLLYAATKERKSVIVSIIVSVVTSVILWFIFGFVFNVTLP
ncbi:MAG: conserved rane protein of unknown function [Clostridiales bacterium]|jgi:hypothetical protein|nr:conserved rane protein of unknown function [Clostridiales bacterium]